MQGLEYSVDIALCIDATGSMTSVIERVKSEAMSLCSQLTDRLRERDKIVDTLRIRVIEFRDFYADGDQAMRACDFFRLPDQDAEFSQFVGGITAAGGGDEPENGLEAITVAMNSDWTTAGTRRRHVIVVWTDASAHPLEKNRSAKPPTYPQGIPADFDELTDLWEGQSGMNSSAKRLILFCPDGHGWTDIANHWTNTVQYPSKAGEGLSDVDLATILDTIAESV